MGERRTGERSISGTVVAPAAPMRSRWLILGSAVVSPLVACGGTLPGAGAEPRPVAEPPATADAGTGETPAAEHRPWTHPYTGEVQIDGIAADARGDVYSAGYFVGRATFGEGHVFDSVAGTDGPTKDIFVAKHLAATGELAWVRHFGGSGAEGNVYDVTVSEDGTVVLSGAFSGEVDFEGTRLVSTASAGSGTSSSGTYGSMFLVGVDAGGHVRWARQATGEVLSGGNEVAKAAGGGVLQVGIYGGRDAPGGSLGLGATELPFGGGTYDSYVARLDATGSVVWANAVSGTGAQRGKAIAEDEEGNVLVAGDAWSGSTELAPGDSFASDEQDFWVAKYSASGALLWSRHFASSGVDEVKGIGADKAGNVVVAASFAGPALELDPATRAVATTGAKNTGVVFALSPDGQTVAWMNTLTQVSKCCELEVEGEHTFVGLAALGPSVTYADGAVFPVGGAPRGALLAELGPGGRQARSWTVQAESAEFGELALQPGAVAVAGSFTGPTARFGDLVMAGTMARTQFVLSLAR